MITALFTYDYGEERLNQVRALGYNVMMRPEKHLVYEPDLEPVEVLVCYSPFKELDITRMPNLKWIQLSSIGVDQVPQDAAEAARMIVTNNRGGYSVPIGEWIVLKILEIYKQSKHFYTSQAAHTWSPSTDVLELCGKRIGIVGTGTIAQEAAKRLKGFGVTLVGFNTGGRSAEHFDQCYPIHLLERWIQRFDVLVLAVPATDDTRHLIGRNLLRKMKERAVLINVSRGTVLDETALLDQLNAGRFLGVALDVFDQEPLSPESPFWSIERVYVTPHNCWVSELRNERRFETILENLKRYRQQQPLLNVVDLKKGY